MMIFILKIIVVMRMLGNKKKSLKMECGTVRPTAVLYFLCNGHKVILESGLKQFGAIAICHPVV